MRFCVTSIDSGHEVTTSRADLNSSPDRRGVDRSSGLAHHRIRPARARIPGDRRPTRRHDLAVSTAARQPPDPPALRKEVHYFDLQYAEGRNWYLSDFSVGGVPV